MKHCQLYFTASTLFLKNLLFKLCVKMLLSNQIVGFFKVSYLKKEVRGQVDFLYVKKHQSFLQGYTIVLAWVARHAENT